MWEIFNKIFKKDVSMKNEISESKDTEKYIDTEIEKLGKKIEKIKNQCASDLYTGRYTTNVKYMRIADVKELLHNSSLYDVSEGLRRYIHDYSESFGIIPGSNLCGYSYLEFISKELNNDFSIVISDECRLGIKIGNLIYSDGCIYERAYNARKPHPGPQSLEVYAENPISPIFAKTIIDKSIQYKAFSFQEDENAYKPSGPIRKIVNFKHLFIGNFILSASNIDYDCLNSIKELGKKVYNGHITYNELKSSISVFSKIINEMVFQLKDPLTTLEFNPKSNLITIVKAPSSHVLNKGIHLSNQALVVIRTAMKEVNRTFICDLDGHNAGCAGSCIDDVLKFDIRFFGEDDDLSRQIEKLYLAPSSGCENSESLYFYRAGTGPINSKPVIIVEKSSDKDGGINIYLDNDIEEIHSRNLKELFATDFIRIIEDNYYESLK